MQILLLKLDYVEIPVLFKVVIPTEGSKFKPSLFVGPALGFNIDAKIKGEYQGQSAEEDIDSIGKINGFFIGIWWWNWLYDRSIMNLVLI